VWCTQNVSATVASCNTSALVVQDGSWLRAPLDYDILSSNMSYSLGPTFSAWRPVSPAGFVCLGDVISEQKPALDYVRCVSLSVLKSLTADPNVDMWTSQGCVAGNTSNCSQGTSKDRCVNMYTDAQGTLRVLSFPNNTGKPPQWTASTDAAKVTSPTFCVFLLHIVQKWGSTAVKANRIILRAASDCMLVFLLPLCFVCSW
jgi:hypothetical protein